MVDKTGIRLPYIRELYNQGEDDVMCFAIYWETDCNEVQEWHIYAKTHNEALGAFFVENVNVRFSEIIDTFEI